ncbi:MAG: hypothetical protein CVV24_05465, partial [Ignavibacteriae bacterium HGW-Ignavibacteriae-3]
MSSKIKNTVIILLLLIAIGLISVFYNFVYQKGKITDRQKKIKELNVYRMDTELLNKQLALYKRRVAELDSILVNRKYNIPFNTSQASFFDFINRVNYRFSSQSHVNIEFNDV